MGWCIFWCINSHRSKFKYFKMTFINTNPLLFKKIGPLESSLIAMIKTKNTGDNITNPTIERIISIILLTLNKPYYKILHPILKQTLP